MSGDVDYTNCPDCRVYNDEGVWCRSEACGLTWDEHRWMAEERKKAEAEAHQLIVEGRAQQLLPRAIIKAIYDEAEQAANRRQPHR